jgi:hypothetical protein
MLLFLVISVIAVSCGDSSELTKKKDLNLNNFDPEKTPLIFGKEKKVSTIKSVTFVEFENPDIIELQFNRRIIVSPDTLMSWMNTEGIIGYQISRDNIILLKAEESTWSELRPKIVAIVEKQGS